MNQNQDVQDERVEALRRKQTEELQKRQVLKSILDAPAYERMANIRIANPALYDQLVLLLMQLVQSGRVSGKITDSQLRALLDRIQARRHEPQISFKRK